MPQQLERPISLAIVQLPAGRLRQDVERIHQILPGLESTPPLDRPAAQEENDEDDVDDRRGRLEEVVVVSGDELPDFVDEDPEPDAAEERGRRSQGATDEGEQQADGDEHEQPAPEEMSDLQVAPSQLGIVRQPQLRADDQDRHDSGL
jgi:hypothetical protein